MSKTLSLDAGTPLARKCSKEVTGCNFISPPRDTTLANPDAQTRFDEPVWKIIEEGISAGSQPRCLLASLIAPSAESGRCIYFQYRSVPVLIPDCAIPDRIPAARREPRERSGNKLNCTIPRSVRSGHGPSVMGWKPISDRNHPSSLSVKRGEASQPGVLVISIFGQFRIAPVRIRSRGFHLNHSPTREIPGIDYLAGISGIDRRSRNGNFPKRRLSRCTEKN